MDETPPNQPPAKRSYTLSPAAIEARRQNAQHSTGPKTEEGKAASSRNAWQHGLYSGAAKLTAQQWGTVNLLGKPCRSTCQYHPEREGCVAPCHLVLEGHTKAGGDCLDKTVYLTAFDGLLQSMQSGKADSMQEILAAEAAGAMEILVRLREEIAEHGLSIEIPAISKDGDVILHPETGKPVASKIVTNPALAQYGNLLDKLGINLSNLLATPRAVAGLDQQEDGANAMAALLGSAFRNVTGGQGRVIEGEAE